MAFDMVTTGTTYDDITNTMTVGSTENCLTTAAPGNNLTHTHPVQIVIKNVEDMIGWQARLNYLGDKMRPNTVSFTPFTDTGLAQAISFNNLPIDQSTFVHRDLVTASSIPASAAGPQTASFGASYLGAQDFPISPDTPAKPVPDDSSYSAPSGGYADGNRHSHTNTNSHRDSHADGDRHAHTNTNSHRDSNADGDRHAHTDTDGNGVRDPNSHAYRYPDGNRNPYTNPDGHCDGYADSYRHAYTNTDGNGVRDPNCHANGNRHGDCHTHRYGYSHADA